MRTVYTVKLPCPLCGNTTYTKGENQQTIYHCTTKKPDGSKCFGSLYKCNKCNLIYYKTNFGKHGDVWECKTCGAVQWDLTDEQNVLSKIRSANKALELYKLTHGL